MMQSKVALSCACNLQRTIVLKFRGSCGHASRETFFSLSSACKQMQRPSKTLTVREYAEASRTHGDASDPLNSSVHRFEYIHWAQTLHELCSCLAK
eukprot:3203133-Amphidinium_carterae.1